MSAEQLTAVGGPNHVKIFSGGAAIGAVLVGAGLAIEGARGWAALLHAGTYVVTLAATAALLVSLAYVTGAGWSVVFRRVPEAIGAAAPWGALVLAPAMIGIGALYHWSHADVLAEDPILAGKAPWLNVPFFLGRTAGYVAIWALFAWILRKNSVAQDHDGDLAHTRANVRWATLYIIVYALTFAAASFDWLMSLDPHWFSTMWGVYNFAGSMVSALATTLVVLVLLRRGGALPELKDDHLHDLGRLLFGFTCFWAYIWFSQYMLIWYANIPEETEWFVHRGHGGWEVLYWAIPILLFVVPFFALLPRASKRSGSVLLQVSLVILVGRWVDLFVTIQPAVSETPALGLSEIGATLLGLCVLALAIGAGLRKASMVPRKDPFLEESLHHHVGHTM
ncbi:MAG: hypothetical protein M5U28_16920 [Sandaracinaceae bacterium]|nr:hypothetical protein [Sandaracinaceae bacterium]